MTVRYFVHEVETEGRPDGVMVSRVESGKPSRFARLKDTDFAEPPHNAARLAPIRADAT